MTGHVSVTGEDQGAVTDRGSDRGTADTDVTGQPAPSFRIEATREYVPSGAKARFEANMATIERVRELTETGRPVTAHDQTVLSGWSSWGAIPDVFDESKESWARERERLSAALSDDEWEAARATTINAHYTSPAIVAEMWAGITGLGLTQGRVLEPGCGSGNFLGAAPADMSMVGIELDPLTAQIAKYLHPAAEVRNESFGRTLVRPNQFDAAIANVPFGQFPVFDPSWNPGERFSIHNHFIRKAVGGLHDGGIAVMMTSAYTMDAKNPAFRAELSSEADLLGAIRLPTGAHQRTAGTDVVTDILILRKRLPGEDPTTETLRWVKTQPTQFDRATGRPLMNRYFHDHPENVLGTLQQSTFRDSQINVIPEDQSVVPEQVRTRITAIVTGALEQGRGYVAPSADVLAERERPVSIDLAPGQWVGTLIETEPGVFVRAMRDVTEEVTVPKNAAAEVRSLMDLRDRAVALIEGQVSAPVDTDEIVALRDETRQVWETHVSRFGPINRFHTRWKTKTVKNEDTGVTEKVRFEERVEPRAAKIMRADPMWSLTKALENFNEETGESSAADILHHRTVEQNRPLLGADTPEEALALCLDARGKAELSRIANLLGTDEADARAELGDLVYDDPETGQLATRAEYLSGNVRKKLVAAEDAAQSDDRYQVNVQALTGVIPEDIPIEDITATVGAVWISADDHEKFLKEIAGDRSATVHRAGSGFWDVQHGGPGRRQTVKATSEWGTERMPVYDLYRKLLTGSEIRVVDTLEDGGSVLNPTETEAARAKADEIAERFEEWVWEEPGRADRLSAEYNRRFNSLVPRDYTEEAERLRLPGLAADWTPHPHQKTAVARMIAEPAVGLFHVVGAGKTGAAVMGMMELKRRGLVSKPAVLVPGHMLEQFTREWQEMYPNAKLLSAGSDDLAAKAGSLGGRRAFIAKATTGDWDGIVMTHSAFRMLGVKEATAKAYFREITADLEQARADMSAASDNPSNRTVKRIEAAKKKQEARLEKILAKADDENLSFEDTGIDYLTVDEAHLFKNLHTPSAIAGAFIEGSERATDLDMKLQYLRDTYGERVVTMATGTPIANSITEAHVMARYLRPDLLEDAGVRNFDQWGATFGETVTRIERDAAGRLKQRTRFAKFKNIPEMLSSWQQFADVRRSEDLDLPVPQQQTNTDGERRPEMVIIPRTDSHAAFMETLEARLDRLSGRPEKGEDNHLKVYGDGRKVALDPRMVGMEFSGDVKLNYVTRRIASIWRATRENEYTVPGTSEISETRGALQIVFCDLSTPNEEEWNAYDQMKSDLVSRHGLTRDRIRFIHEARDDEQRAKLFKDAREGRIDVLIGSSQKMGTGANIQARAVALHHVDCPWRPDELEQREGRILRQGNQNSEVQIYRYATENTFDSTSWDIIGRKATAIAQVMRGRLDVRELDDPGDLALDAQQLMAASSGNPLLMERTELDVTVQKLSRRSRGYERAQAALRYRQASAQQRLDHLQRVLPHVEAALQRRVETRGDLFQARVDGRVYDKRQEASEAIYSLVSGSLNGRSGRLDAGEPRVHVGGLAVVLSVEYSSSEGRRLIAVLDGINADQDAVRVDVDLEAVLDAGNGHRPNIAQLIEHRVQGLDRVRERMMRNREEASTELANAKAQLGKPFRYADELETAKAELAAIDQKIAAMQEEEGKAKAGRSERSGENSPESPAADVDGEPGGSGAGVDAATLDAQEARKKAAVGRGDRASSLVLDTAFPAFNEFSMRSRIPLDRASEMDRFWTAMRTVESTLAEAATAYREASECSGTRTERQLYDGAARARVAAAEMVAKARAARVPSQAVTDLYLRERMPHRAGTVTESHAYRVAKRASVESVVRALRTVSESSSPDSVAELRDQVEAVTAAITEFTENERAAQTRVGKQIAGAAMAEECIKQLNAEDSAGVVSWNKSSRARLTGLSSEDVALVEACLRGEPTCERVEELKREIPETVVALGDVQGLRQGIPMLPPRGAEATKMVATDRAPQRTAEPLHHGLGLD